MIRQFCSVVLAVLAVASGWAHADEDPFAGGDPGGDLMLLAAPEGWHAVEQIRQDGVYLVRHVPAESTGETWNWAVKAQIFFNLSANRPDISAADFAENMQRLYASQCDGSNSSPISAFQEWGYEAAVRLITCPRLLGQARGSVSMLKVMKGRASFFLVERMWRGDPFLDQDTPISQAALDEWAEFFTGVTLCNPTHPDRPCPSGIAADPE